MGNINDGLLFERHLNGGHKEGATGLTEALDDGLEHIKLDSDDLGKISQTGWPANAAIVAASFG